jgi:signal transduction histidine kinase
MISVLRAVRQEYRITYLRTRRSTEEIFKALPIAIAVLDQDGRVDITTGPADRLFGFKQGILVKDLGFDWLPSLLMTVIDENRPAESDPKYGYVQRFEGSRECFFQPMAVPITEGANGKAMVGTALILKDVTQAHEQAEIKRGLLATVSHQLKTPLTSFRMAVHILLGEKLGPLSEKQSELLVAARDESERLATILDDLLDIQRMASGKSQVSLLPVQPSDLVRECVEPFMTEARDKGITLVNSVDDDLPPVLADMEKIRHVFMNLVTNAIRFTLPGGTVTINARKDDGNVFFSIEDTGSGIPESDLPHVFDPFFRVPGQEGKSGAGLGLAIVKEIVTAHGGKVSAESRVGKGSIIGFTLPVEKENG